MSDRLVGLTVGGAVGAAVGAALVALATRGNTLGWIARVVLVLHFAVAVAQSTVVELRRAAQRV